MEGRAWTLSAEENGRDTMWRAIARITLFLIMLVGWWAVNTQSAFSYLFSFNLCLCGTENTASNIILVEPVYNV